MKLLLGALLFLALPSTAWAVTLDPPNPDTISKSGTGAPMCTDLSFRTSKPNYKMTLKVFGPAGEKVFEWKGLQVAAGTHDVTYCGSGTRPGTATWLVIAWHYRDQIGGPGAVKHGEPITVTT
jgi:hypothetical protein